MRFQLDPTAGQWKIVTANRGYFRSKISCLKTNNFTTRVTYFPPGFLLRCPWFWCLGQGAKELAQMWSAPGHQAALLICESDDKEQKPLPVDLVKPVLGLTLTTPPETRAYPSFCSMKWLQVSSNTLPAWDASPSQVPPSIFVRLPFKSAVSI